MLLIFPPVAKAGEPPAGICCLAAALKKHQISYTLADLNLEGQLYLIKNSPQPTSTWGKRAFTNREFNLEKIRSKHTYTNLSRYGRTVSDLNKSLLDQGSTYDLQISLGNLQSTKLSATNSQHLLKSFRHPEQDIFFPFFSKRLEELIYTHSPDKIGISLNFLSQAITTFAMGGFLSKNYPEIELFLGGGLITTWASGTTQELPFSDIFNVIDGPGENKILELYGITTDKEHYCPDFSGLPLEKYFSPGLILPYPASRGCYWNKCSFCPERAEESPYLQTRPTLVSSDLRNLTEQYSPRLIHLLDNAISIGVMEALIHKPPGAEWYGFARVSKKLSDPSFCLALKNSGCSMLKLGIESGSQAVLDSMKKGIKLHEVSQALKALHNAGIRTYVYLLFGTPHETIKEALETRDFIVRHQQYVDFLNLAIFNMPIKSPESQLTTTQPFTDDDLSMYTNFTHPKGWNRKKIRAFLSNEFRPHQKIRQILAQDPPFFTSNHAALFPKRTA